MLVRIFFLTKDYKMKGKNKIKYSSKYYPHFLHLEDLPNVFILLEMRRENDFESWLSLLFKTSTVLLPWLV